MEQWHTLQSESDLEAVLEASKDQPQLIFKHSTSCFISAGAKRELEQATDDISTHADINYVGVIQQRPVSNAIASRLDITHESPQLILVENGEPIWDLSHGAITGQRVLEKVKEAADQS